MDGLFCREGVDPLSHCAHGLAGEAGEVADLVKKSQYENGDLDVRKMLEELGDVLWYLTNLSGQLGYTLDEIAGINITKLAARHPHLYSKYEEVVSAARFSSTATR